MDYHIMELTSKPASKMDLQALAEVAIGRLMEEQDEALTASKTKIVSKNYSLKQIRKLSEKKLLTTFAERFKRVVDKNTKVFSYKCQILPHECQLKLECYAPAEEEALKARMVDHLLGHLCNLEKCAPSIKISSKRTVKSRNRTTAAQATSSSTKASTSSVSALKSRAPKSVPESATAAPVNSSPNITIQQHQHQSVITTTGGSPLDMSTNSMVLKFLEEDHAYTMAAVPTVPMSVSVVAGGEQYSTPEVVSASYHHHPSVITNLPPSSISQTIEIRTTTSITSSASGGQQSTSSSVMSGAAPVDPSLAQNSIRALALDYIDDIRKKSSSAAKSIIVNGDKSLVYQCKICPDKQFTSTNGLIFHYKKHAGLKPYVCDLCSATFTRQHSLNYHMLIHLNKSRFVCSECGRHFRHPSHFKEHMRRHTGETPFQCGDCLIRFKTRNTYKRHLQTKHAKILTSKGIIEISNATGYQSGAASRQTSGGGGGNSGATSSGAAVLAGAMAAIDMEPLSPTPASSKPRRKYAMRYLHKNLEAVSKYDDDQDVSLPTTLQQVQQTLAVAPISLPVVEFQGQPLDYSQHQQQQQAQNLSLHSGHGLPGSSITILQIPQLAGVHLLDNTGAPMSPSSGLTKVDLPEGYQHHHQQQHLPESAAQSGGITLVSYQPHHHLEPIQPTACSNPLLASPPMSSGHLTELTSSPAMMGMTALSTTAAGSAVTGDAASHQGHSQHQHDLQPAVLPTTHTTSPNDNFNLLMAAIQMSEEEPKQEV